MKQGADLSVHIGGFVVIHQNLPGLWVREHAHPHHEIFIPLTGELKVRVDDKLWMVPPGQMLWLEGNEKHSFETSPEEPGERLILMFEPACWREHRGTAKPSRVLPAHQLLKEIAFYMLTHPKSEANSALTNAMVRCISEQLADNAGTQDDFLQKPGVDPRIKIALEFVRANFVQEISVEQISKHAQVTSRTLARLFQTELGLSPKQVLTKYRIQEACRLFRETELSVTDVAFESGFGSLSSFVESFRNQVGILPSDYKTSCTQ